MFGQLIVEGLAIGACYALFGIAVVIIYKTSEVVNFAQGEMAMLSTFVAYHILSFYEWPFWLAFIGTMVFAVLLGIFIEFAFLRPAKDPSLLGLIVITLGAEMLLMGVAGWKWGAEQKEFSLPFSFQNTHEMFEGIVINDWTIAVFIMAACLMIFLYIFSATPRWGLPCGPPSRTSTRRGSWEFGWSGSFLLPGASVPSSAPSPPCFSPPVPPSIRRS